MGKNVFIDLLKQAGVDTSVPGTLDAQLERLRDLVKLNSPDVILINQCLLVVRHAAREVTYRDGFKEVLEAIEDAPLSSEEPKPPEPEVALAGRNEPCPCGSGKKYKKCCLKK